MVESALSRLSEVFSSLTDPRMARGKRYPFHGMVSLVFLGLLARITEMAVLVRWATAHWDQLQEPLGFTRNTPPCDTTISRSLAKLSLAEFREAFVSWLKVALAEAEAKTEAETEAEKLKAQKSGPWVAAVDGKTCRQGLGVDGSPAHMLNVFLQQTKLALDQWSVQGDKTNEPGCLKQHLDELLSTYPALGMLTGDAIFAQRPLLKLLQQHGCDYLFQVKANQPDVLDALKTCFAAVESTRPAYEAHGKRGLASKPAGCGSTWTMPSTFASL